ncbi:hypothetical protein KR032_004623 [Drosophila birchii]|nr:hypothetical protein KR032_004623 [Drosophila birchii]
MSAIRILLIFTIIAGLLVLSPACPNYSYCVPFTGQNGCTKGDYTEPDLPPIDNDCCGPHCRYTALNGPPSETCDNTIIRGRCLLDTHCVGNITFVYKNMTDCQFRQANEDRASAGYAREYLILRNHMFSEFIPIFVYSGYLAFNWTEATCNQQKNKCGINCCCRETCPTKFCNIVTSTTCP